MLQNLAIFSELKSFLNLVPYVAVALENTSMVARVTDDDNDEKK